MILRVLVSGAGMAADRLMRIIEHGATPRVCLIPHLAHDFMADFVLEHRPLRDQAETEPVVDHGKSAAGQLRQTQKLSAHGLALFNRPEGKTPLGGELAACPLHFLLLKGRDKIGSWSPRAVDCSRGMEDQLVDAPIESLTDLDAESAQMGHRCQARIGWDDDTFLSAYRDNRRCVSESAFEADSVAVAIRNFVATAHPDGWEGTATQLLVELNQRTAEGITPKDAILAAHGASPWKSRRAHPSSPAGGRPSGAHALRPLLAERGGRSFRDREGLAHERECRPATRFSRVENSIAVGVRKGSASHCGRLDHQTECVLTY
jgi:hypothetical protein